MSMFILKIIAIITMTIDHMGVFLFPEHIGFRIIGRLSFIIFAFLIVNGYKYTHNKERYLIRLIIMGFISQIPDMLGIINYVGNIFFTLSIGLATVMVLASDRKLKYIYYVLLIGLAVLLNVDYGIYGVLVINAFYLIDRYQINIPLQIAIFIALNYFGIKVEHFASIQYYSLFSLPIIWSYNQKLGYHNKYLSYFFYWYYPVHLTILAIISYF